MEASSPASSIWVGFQQGAVKVAGTDLHSVREQAAVGLGLKVAPGFIFFTVDEEADIIPPDKPLQELIADVVLEAPFPTALLYILPPLHLPLPPKDPHLAAASVPLSNPKHCHLTLKTISTRARESFRR